MKETPGTSQAVGGFRLRGASAQRAPHRTAAVRRLRGTSARRADAQPLATLLAAPLDDQSTAPSAHPRQKAMRAVALLVARLKRALHGTLLRSHDLDRADRSTAGWTRGGNLARGSRIVKEGIGAAPPRRGHCGPRRGKRPRFRNVRKSAGGADSRPRGPRKKDPVRSPADHPGAHFLSLQPPEASATVPLVSREAHQQPFPEQHRVRAAVRENRGRRELRSVHQAPAISRVAEKRPSTVLWTRWGLFAISSRIRWVAIVTTCGRTRGSMR